MAESPHTPGSRAIKIPISKLKKSTVFGQQDLDVNMQRTDSTEGSSSEASSSVTPVKRDLKMTTYSPINVVPEESRRKDKQKAFSAQSPQQLWSPSLSPSMLASSSYKSVNLNSHADPDTPPRLICYTKSSQGFTWNDELFLPSYLIGRRYRGSKNRRWGQNDDDMDEDDVPFDEEIDRCPVMDIFVTDEEAARMLP